jgi:CRP-like cAMP-binding protein
MQPTEEQKEQFKKAINEIFSIGDQCWLEIQELIYLKQLDKKDYFSNEGQKAKDFCFILSGIFRIFYANSKGEEWNKYFLQKGNFVSASISPEHTSISNVQALTKCNILCIAYSELIRISKTHKQIKEFIQKLTFTYLEQKHRREITLLSQNAINKYLFFKREFPNLENKIQHYHIASYLGITPTQLSRLRKKHISDQQM